MTPDRGDDQPSTNTSLRAETTTETITRTIRLRLDASGWKRDHVRRAIAEWQRVAAHTATLLPSFPPYRWGSRDTQLRRVVRREMDDLDIYAHDRDAAVAKVREAFASWHKRGQEGDYPTGDFGDGDYLRMSTSSSSKQRRTLVANEQGYGLQVSLLKDEDPVWFHTSVGDYQREWLEKVLDGDADLGVVELRFADDRLWAHVSVAEEVEVYAPGDVDTAVGVDFGERVLYAVAVVGPDGVEAVEMEPGGEFRHHRDRLDRRRDRLAERGDLDAVRATKRDRERYTEQVTHTATRRIVDLAAEYAPCVVRFEDLSGYRGSATDPIHDWPHGMLTRQLAYKTTEAGLPVEAVDPAGTSITCRQCGAVDEEFRDGDAFECGECGYEVHADVNGAINIARQG